MSASPGPIVTLVRHGQTTWSVNGKHTGSTDIPLTPIGEAQSQALAKTLGRYDFARVLTSPMHRAIATCDLAGFGASAEIDPDLSEWNYGDYEGITSPEVWKTNPGWRVFDNGAPGGESPEQIGARADRLLSSIRAVDGRVALFAHSHILRVIGARWLGLDARAGQYFVLSTASVSELGYEHGQPVLTLWNDTSHLD